MRIYSCELNTTEKCCLWDFNIVRKGRSNPMGLIRELLFPLRYKVLWIKIEICSNGP